MVITLVKLRRVVVPEESIGIMDKRDVFVYVNFCFLPPLSLAVSFFLFHYFFLPEFLNKCDTILKICFDDGGRVG